jgi:hypothetical protein
LLDDNYFSTWISLLGEKSSPETGVTGADNAEVCSNITNESRMRFRLKRVRVQPPEIRLHVSEVA